MDNQNFSEIKKSFSNLKINIDKGSKELSKTFSSVASVLSKNFKDLSSIDFSKNTKGLQGALGKIELNIADTSKAIGASLGLVQRANGSIQGALSGINALGALEDPNQLGKTAGTAKDLIKKVFPKSSPWVDLASKLFSFDTGGVIPGNYSQAMPIVAHGSEMILNPSQQANMFKMINGQGQASATVAPNYVYAPQVRTGASAHEVFDVLQNHSRQFFSMVADGVHTDSGLRNAVRGG